MRRPVRRNCDVALGVIGLVLATGAGILTAREILLFDGEFFEEPRGRVYMAWAVPAVLAPVLAVIALFRTVRVGGSPRAAVIAGAGLCVGIAGVIGLNVLHGRADDELWTRHARDECSENLRTHVWRALAEFARSNGGAFPDLFGQLYEGGILAGHFTHCPARREYLNRAEFAASLDDPAHFGNAYVYVGAGLRPTNEERAVSVLYEHIKNHEHGVHVLYSDGSVRWVRGPWTVPTTSPAAPPG